MDLSNVWIAMLLTLLAGLSTGIGGLIVLFFKQINIKILSVSLGFSAGVMIYISFVELLAESRNLLISSLGGLGSWVNILAFFAGILLIAVIDKLIPSATNPHESPHKVEESDKYDLFNGNKLLRTGIFTALVIAIHNFPEGMATFVSSVQQLSLGIAVAIAIAIHNIPEGISVAIPVYSATGSRKKALSWSLISGIGEPLGAILAYLVFLPILNDTVFGILFAAIAGIMVFISLDELLPTAEEYGEHHLTIYGLITGMAVMAVGLLVTA
jgi:ZIP family zinc transporter